MKAVGHEPPHPLLGAFVEKMLQRKAVGHEPPHPLLGAFRRKDVERKLKENFEEWSSCIDFCLIVGRKTASSEGRGA